MQITNTKYMQNVVNIASTSLQDLKMKQEAQWPVRCACHVPVSTTENAPNDLGLNLNT